jgi:hypothetical protein
MEDKDGMNKAITKCPHCGQAGTAPAPVLDRWLKDALA